MEISLYNELSKETIKQIADCIQKRYVQCEHGEYELSYPQALAGLGLIILRCLDCDNVLVFHSKALDWGKNKLEEKG